MNTPTAYALRAKAARDAAREVLASEDPFTRPDEVRVAHLSDYAARCAELTSAAAGNAGGEILCRAGYFADETRGLLIRLQASRRRASDIRMGRV